MPPEAFDRYRETLDTALKSLVPGSPEGLYGLLRYHLGWAGPDGEPTAGGSRGKALRPTLCFLVCEALSGEWSQVANQAATLEFIHNFTLIHDDIQDHDLERRGRPTVWSIWGVEKGLWAGNVMRSLADRAMTLGSLPVPKTVRASELLTQAYLETMEGQYMDLEFETRAGIGTEDYIAMISRKTGALIRCAMEVGALVGTDDEDTVRILRDCGAHLGLAFQVRDDILGIWGDEAATGKATGNDIRRKKKSFPVVYGLANAAGSARRVLDAAYGASEVDEAQVADVLDVLATMGADREAQALVDEHSQQALAVLAREEAPISPWGRRQLEDLVQFLAYRDR